MDGPFGDWVALSGLPTNSLFQDEAGGWFVLARARGPGGEPIDKGITTSVGAVNNGGPLRCDQKVRPLDLGALLCDYEQARRVLADVNQEGLFRAGLLEGLGRAARVAEEYGMGDPERGDPERTEGSISAAAFEAKYGLHRSLATVLWSLALAVRERNG